MNGRLPAPYRVVCDNDSGQQGGDVWQKTPSSDELMILSLPETS
jgi:hypothetical protein